MTVNPEEMLTVQQAADMLGIHVATAHRWYDSGKMKGVEIAGIKFVRKDEVARLLKSNGQESEAAEG